MTLSVAWWKKSSGEDDTPSICALLIGKANRLGLKKQIYPYQVATYRYIPTMMLINSTNKRSAWKILKRLFFSTALFVLVTSAAFTADLEGRTLRIGTDASNPPMETIDATTGVIVGFDIDVITAVCEKVNCSPRFVNTTWDGIFAALKRGEFDMVISSVSITPEREKTMDFSIPYIVISQAILLQADNADMTLQDFTAGSQKLAAQIGTTNAQLAEDLVGQENVFLYDNFSAAILALLNNNVQGVVIDGTSATAYEQQFAGELTAGITGLRSDSLGIVFQKGDAMVDAINAGLEAIKADGTLDKLVSKYWGDE